MKTTSVRSFDPWSQIDTFQDEGEEGWSNAMREPQTSFETYEERRLVERPLPRTSETLGGIFLMQMAQDTARQIRSLDISQLRKGRVNQEQMDAFEEKRRAFEMDPFRSECPKFVTEVAQILFEKREYEKVINLLTLTDQKGGKISKWPSSFTVADFLARIYEKNKAHDDIIHLMTDQDGKPRFPNNKNAMRCLSYAYNNTGKYEKTACLCDENSMADELFEDHDFCANYIYALNALKRSSEAVEKFIDREGRLKLPCQTSPNLLTQIGIALNQLGMYQLTGKLLLPVLKEASYNSNGKYMYALASAMSELGYYGRAMELLMYQNGEYRFPDNAHCMRMLGHMLIKSDRLAEAEWLLQFVKSNIKLAGEDFSGVENHLLRKKWPGSQSQI